MSGINPAMDELAAHQFSLLAAIYRAEPTEASFEALLAAKPLLNESACVSSIVYEVARALDFRLPVLAHLSRALAAEQRLLEAAWFTTKWAVEAPHSLGAQRWAVIVMCQRHDDVGARLALEQLQAVPNLTPATLRTMDIRTGRAVSCVSIRIPFKNSRHASLS